MGKISLTKAPLKVVRSLWSPKLIRPLQLSLSLISMIFGILFTAELLGIGVDPRDSVRQSRTTLAESLAVQLSVFASIGDEESIDLTVYNIVTRNEDVRAASLIVESGAVLAEHGDIASLQNVLSTSTLTHLRLPILNGDRTWGEVLIVFKPVGMVARELGWFVFVLGFSFLGFTFFLGRALVQLDPGRVVPSRVENAFDLFTAGVVILDENMRIVMTNNSVSQIVGYPSEELIGTTLDEWPWKKSSDWQAPWATTLHSGLAISDKPISLRGADGTQRLLSVSCSAVGVENESRGVLITLDDVTALENRNKELSSALAELQRSKEAISIKNQELELLATTDPLTGIANRRTLMQTLEQDVKRTIGTGAPLSCIMCDIDHFKRINDTHGHAAGDNVIVAVANVLKAACAQGDTVGRYGGEEFLVLLPGKTQHEAAELGEKIRVGVIALAAGKRIGEVNSLSSSFGVAELGHGTNDGAALVDSADQALYSAKETGRNKVVIFDRQRQDSSTPGSVDQEASFELSNEDKAFARIVELERQLSEHKQQLVSLREFDTLTGMPMRDLFLQRVHTELVRAKRHGTIVGVMSFELRDLERIISKFGHSTSDAVVVQFVDRIQTGLRTTDLVSDLTNEHSVSRITSNEYGVLLSELTDTAGAMIVVTRLKRLLMQPFLIGDERLYIGMNIGISLSYSNETDASELFGQARDARLEASDKPDKISHSFASAELEDHSDDYIRLEADLHDALENQELEVWFQPKFDLVKRKVTGMEALLRWHHETRGYVSPEVFVAVAEANGMIGRLSSFVLGRTLNQIKVWNAMGIDDICVSVNVSPMQLKAKSFTSDTLSELKASAVAGSQLEIELTETSVLDRPEEVRASLRVLRNEGIKVSMDDFGTGYTSLALLADLPLDTVKIDRSFITPITHNDRCCAIVGSIITMAHGLDLRVVAEGVETNEELEALSALSCDEVQGYLISRAQPAEKITAFLVDQRHSEGGRRRA